MTNPTRDPIEAAINALVAETGTVCPSGAIGQYIEADSIEDLRDGMIAAIAAYLEAQWQDIATAPKDGTLILAYFAGGGTSWYFDRYVCRWISDLEMWSAKGVSGLQPDMWQPLPEPPKEAK